MRITAIKQQLKRADRYSVFVDDVYSFSLSETALLESHLVRGQELDTGQLTAFKQLSADDKLYSRALRYAAMRPRSVWEMKSYLTRHDSPAPLTEQITNKLQMFDLVNDTALARSFVHDRQLLRPTSRRKLTQELKKKRISQTDIEAALEANEMTESEGLQAVIVKMRRQTRYRDDQKLMQYLARQGFNYGDIKAALNQDDEN